MPPGRTILEVVQPAASRAAVDADAIVFDHDGDGAILCCHFDGDVVGACVPDGVAEQLSSHRDHIVGEVVADHEIDGTREADGGRPAC